MTEGVAFHMALKQLTSFNEWAWLSWQQSKQQQERGGSQITCHTLSYPFNGTSHERSKQ